VFVWKAIRVAVHSLVGPVSSTGWMRVAAASDPEA
jgi:hypothetical protein